MKKSLAAVLTAFALLTVSPGVAHASGGSSSSSTSAWPTATAPLPAGTVLSQSSKQAVVVTAASVSASLSALDAAYVKAGYTKGSSAGIPRWYKGQGRQVNVYYAFLTMTSSQFTLKIA